MNLFEFFNPTSKPDYDADNGRQNLEDDNSVPAMYNMRKTKLTLKQINKLRQLNDVRMYEYQEDLKKIKKQYAPPAPAGI